jgi:L-amino acid N-acyltransferase YncA
MHIRDATKKDLSAIVDIYNAAIPSRIATGDLDPVSIESRSRWFEEHNPQSRPIWVVECEGTIAGWLSLQSFYYGRLAYQTTAEISIYISPSYQCNGIGRLLLEWAIKRSPDLGIKTLVGFIFGHNQPSLKLFQKFGFQQWGCFPSVAQLDGLERDLIVVGLRVT